MTKPPLVEGPSPRSNAIKWGLRVAAALFVAVVVLWYWNDLFHTFGMGIFLLAVACIALIVVITKHKYSLLWRRWNWWLGGVVFGLFIFGVLAFIYPVSGPLKDYSLGGTFGSAIIAHSRDIVGVFRLLCLAILIAALILPHPTWRATRATGRETKDLSCKAYDQGKQLATKLHDNYKERRSRQSAADESQGQENLLPGQEMTSVLSSEGSQASIATSAAPKGSPQTAKAKGKSPMQLELPIAGSPAGPALGARLSGRWQLPSLELLDKSVATEFSPAEMERRAQIINDALSSYGVEAKVVETNPGPAVTQFGVEPGWDRKYKQVKEEDKDGNAVTRTKEVSKTRVKVERIKALENDIALALAAPSIRIEAPVPGKSLVGIEVPNSAMSLVTMRDTVESVSFQRLAAKSKLSIALGKGSAGEMVSADLAKMPHLLIAGATGSGKTVCLDSIIVSLLMNNTPDELQMVMIDPKRVELIAFEGLPHLTAPVVTDADRTVVALKWLTHEMEARFRKLAHVGANNIDNFNKSPKVDRPMPNIVLIIDELADLMMAKQADVEPLICRLAQMGRAVGIHEVIATQRPSVDVITGLIKANFPTRISFALVSQIDSRTILDTPGAEKLLGRGDMLFLPADVAKPIRLQGCYVSQEEIRRVVGFWVSQQQPQPIEATETTETATVTEDDDPLFEQAKQLMKEHKQISVSFLQRQLRIGRGRAEEIMLRLENEALGSFAEPTEIPQE